jgi:hypothetical protein
VAFLDEALRVYFKMGEFPKELPITNHKYIAQAKIKEAEKKQLERRVREIGRELLELRKIHTPWDVRPDEKIEDEVPDEVPVEVIPTVVESNFAILDNLPKDLLIKVVLLLDLADVNSLSKTCKKFQVMLSGKLQKIHMDYFLPKDDYRGISLLILNVVEDLKINHNFKLVHNNHYIDISSNALSEEMTFNAVLLKFWDIISKNIDHTLHVGVKNALNSCCIKGVNIVAKSNYIVIRFKIPTKSNISHIVSKMHIKARIYVDEICHGILKYNLKTGVWPKMPSVFIC